jgi:hypothetical protein
MPEVHARFEQLLHGDVSQSTSLFGLHPALTLRLPRIAIPVPAPRGREELNSSKTVVRPWSSVVSQPSSRATNNKI